MNDTRVALLPYYVLFFLSGFPALLYQIVWQRALFTIYGVNIESVTVIVTAFMLGLGLGSIGGGRLSRIQNLPLLGIFGSIEIGIGLFGLTSLSLFHRVASFTAGVSAPKTAVITMLLLLIPTVLMGSTLPLLVAYFVRVTANVGESVGVLYCVNTFGSAIACIASAMFAMRSFGESGSVRMAAIVNTFVGCSALILQRGKGNRDPVSDTSIHSTVSSTLTRNPLRAMPFGMGLVFSATVGFISLAYEIVWYRLYSFVSGGIAPCFALVLGFYLGGIAFGSLFVRDLCSRRLKDDSERTLGFLGSFVIWAGIASFLLAPTVAMLVRNLSYLFTLPLLFVAAALLGAAFPLLSHAAIAPRDEAGSRLSFLYLANIVGSATGSFTVGFVMMDHFSLRAISLILLAVGAVLSLFTLRRYNNGVARVILFGTASALLIATPSSQIYSNLYEKLFYKGKFSQEHVFRQIVETRSGVITVSLDGIVFGGGMYDGRFNTDPNHDSNGIFRAYAISSFHPHPSEVLMIGLSSGSWAQVIANNRDVERLTIVEINPGYMQLIARYKQVGSLLHNPKVEINIDDGRRWLVRNRDKRFDVIVMNTTYNWRANVSNLLSVEFLELVRRHLKPGGIHYYNTTSSARAQLTGATVFPYSLRVWNFLAVSDSPIQVDKVRWEEYMLSYRIDGKPVFNSADASQRANLNKLISLADTLTNHEADQETSMESGESIRQRWKGEQIITDDNMGTEWN